MSEKPGQGSPNYRRSEPSHYARVRAEIQARIDADVEEANFVASFNNTARWSYTDGVAEARRESEIRYGDPEAVKFSETQRVRGPRSVIKFSGSYPALTREMQFLARNDPARTLRIMNALRMILRRTDDLEIVMIIASIWTNEDE